MHFLLYLQGRNLLVKAITALACDHSRNFEQTTTL